MRHASAYVTLGRPTGQFASVKSLVRDYGLLACWLQIRAYFRILPGWLASWLQSRAYLRITVGWLASTKILRQEYERTVGWNKLGIAMRADVRRVTLKLLPVISRPLAELRACETTILITQATKSRTHQNIQSKSPRNLISKSGGLA